ncbi:MAG: AAA family ATPase [Legionellales bacterium]|jgi:putative ATP-dependent endonuclease of OLD family
MYITQVNIENFKCFEGKFSLKLDPGINILVGNNEAGKSTILEAIHLALTGILHGKYLKNELSSYLFNRAVEKKYIDSLSTSNQCEPPKILIELFLTGEKNTSLESLRGNGNDEKNDGYGISFCIEFDHEHKSSYAELIKTSAIKTIPIEYYKVTWQSFARAGLTARDIPIKSALIDSANARIQNGSDLYISRIIRENLEDKERVEISQAHRQMKETFMDTQSVQAINTKINIGANVTDKQVKISVDLSTQNAWEHSLMTYVNEIPFHYIGKGEQSIVKTNLALSHKKSQEANVILLEEPENHLSHTKLNELIKGVMTKLENKQIIVSTHCSFVANKLGLDRLIFLNNLKCMRLNELSKDTEVFFKKLSGYDTLRLVLCKNAILVEGDSDELIVQKAYRLQNNGKLPIEDGVDVITVGIRFKRFLEIAEKINKKVSVVTDNDSNINAIRKKYANYLGENKKENIRICYDEKIDGGPIPNFNYNTLEPKLLKKNDRDKLNTILNTTCKTDDDLHKYMKKNKTKCALKIFDTTHPIEFPEYILNSIKPHHEE